jgi:hypothetical protein
MLKHISRNVVKTGERIDGIDVKTGETTAWMPVKKDIMTGYAKALKMPVPETVRILKAKMIIGEPVAKIISARDRLTALDLFKVTTKPITRTDGITAITAIVADIKTLIGN